MKIENKNNFKTKDLYFAATLIALGYEIISLESISPKSFQFNFNIESQKLAEFENNFWQRKLLVDARTFSDSIKEIKTRIYGQG